MTTNVDAALSESEILGLEGVGGVSEIVPVAPLDVEILDKTETLEVIDQNGAQRSKGLLNDEDPDTDTNEWDNSNIKGPEKEEPGGSGALDDNGDQFEDDEDELLEEQEPNKAEEGARDGVQEMTITGAGDSENDEKWLYACPIMITCNESTEFWLLPHKDITTNESLLDGLDTDCSMEQLFQMLRDAFSLKEINFSMDDELVLRFDQLGLSLGEDNYYCKDITLGDIVKLLVQLTKNSKGRDASKLVLEVSVDTHDRFISTFNYLSELCRDGKGFDFAGDADSDHEEEGDSPVREEAGDNVGEIDGDGEVEFGDDSTRAVLESETDGNLDGVGLQEVGNVAVNAVQQMSETVKIPTSPTEDDVANLESVDQLSEEAVSHPPGIDNVAELGNHDESLKEPGADPGDIEEREDVGIEVLAEDPSTGVVESLAEAEAIESGDGGPDKTSTTTDVLAIPGDSEASGSPFPIELLEYDATPAPDEDDGAFADEAVILTPTSKHGIDDREDDLPGAKRAKHQG